MWTFFISQFTVNGCLWEFWECLRVSDYNTLKVEEDENTDCCCNKQEVQYMYKIHTHTHLYIMNEWTYVYVYRGIRMVGCMGACVHVQNNFYCFPSWCVLKCSLNLFDVKSFLTEFDISTNEHVFEECECLHLICMLIFLSRCTHTHTLNAEATSQLCIGPSSYKHTHAHTNVYGRA